MQVIIGSKAGDDIFRAKNIKELLAHDKFTMVSQGIEYCNEDV